MILGSVYPGGEAIVLLHVRGPAGIEKHVRTVVDTGFADWLALPPQDIRELGLAFRENIRYSLADGGDVMARVFTLQIYWHGKWQQAFAIEMDGGPLLGMAMLQRCFLGIDVIDGGRVEIRPLP